MKSIPSALFLMLALAGSAAAQMKDFHAEKAVSSAPPAEQVDALTREMCEKLHLNEGQYIQLRAANEIKLARAEEIEWQYQNVAQRNVKLSELEGQYEKECSRIMTPSQLSLYHTEYQHEAAPKTTLKENGVG